TNDFPVTADYSARYVAAVGDCSSGPPCRAVFVHDAQTYQTIAETTLVSQGGWGVMFRPRSADLLVHVQRGSDMTGATFAVELWAGPRAEARARQHACHRKRAVADDSGMVVPC